MNCAFGAIVMMALVGAAEEPQDVFRPVPLGEPGHLTYPTELKNKPVYKALPERTPGLVLVDGANRVCTVVTPTKKDRQDLWRLGEELKYHLEKMTGRTVPHVEGLDKKPMSGPVVVINDDDDGKIALETMIIRRTGDELYLGGQGAGISHALTYVLEALGCRYLWPGATGKIVPKREKVVVPEIAFNEVPPLRLREVSVVNPMAKSMREQFLPFIGIKAEDYSKAIAKASTDAPYNRGFWQWHGVGDAYVVRSPSPCFAKRLNTGHYFNDYYKKYGKEHPDWFAEQPDGTREQTASHPRLCLSNPELIEEVVRDRIAFFRAHPEMYSATISMPDGGYNTVCYCENCRKLDAPNAAVLKGFVYRPKRRPVEYVFLTDRVTTFWNAVAERVTKEFPDKKLLVLAYSNHDRPPTRVKPHPALLYQNVSGDYNKVENWEWGRRSLAAWLSFGNETIWRPNCLNGFRSCLPRDFSEHIFNDIEAAKANGVIAVKLDCGDRSHALKAMTYYLVAKALFNPDRLDYATYEQDFCVRGFGKAAPAIHEYFAELRKTFDAAAKLGEGPQGYINLFDIERFAGILGRARELAAGEEAALKRIAFLGIGIESAREVRKLRAAWMTGSMKILQPARETFKAYIRATAFREPFSIDAQSAAWRSGTFLRGTARPVSREDRQAVEKKAAASKPGKGYPDDNGNWIELPD